MPGEISSKALMKIYESELKRLFEDPEKREQASQFFQQRIPSIMEKCDREGIVDLSMCKTPEERSNFIDNLTSCIMAFGAIHPRKDLQDSLSFLRPKENS